MSKSLPSPRLLLSQRPAAGRPPLPTELTLLQGIAIARWCAWVWVIVTTALQQDDLRRPVIASLLMVVALAGCAMCTYLLLHSPHWLLSKRVAVLESVFCMVMLLADGWVFEPGHNFVGGQSLASSGPLVAAMATSAVVGPTWGTLLAAVTAFCRIPAGFLNDFDDWNADVFLSVASTLIQYAIAALMFGLVTRRLRIVETEVISRRARDDIAATLHDGVLQTLALVERRTRGTDPQLAAEARRSDRELRSWLFHGGSQTDADQATTFVSALRIVCDRIAATEDLNVTVNALVDDEVRLSPALKAAVAAVGEALTNVAKHAQSSQVVVFADEIADGYFVSIRDNGVGFKMSLLENSSRQGVAGSIMKRMSDVGGSAEIVSTPGNGTEVRLWSISKDLPSQQNRP
jgi:signal transduction histidine kinase